MVGDMLRVQALIFLTTPFIALPSDCSRADSISAARR